jgi:DNA-directed RNA polymerase specialized sigma24 family protein
MNQLEAFNHVRPLLFAIAYRMVGSVSDAEDNFARSLDTLAKNRNSSAISQSIPVSDSDSLMC